MNCPFCQSELNPGASVCAHCGATEQMVPASWAQFILKLVLPALALVVAIAAWLGPFSVLGLLAFAGVLWLTYHRFKKLPKKSRWVRKVG